MKSTRKAERLSRSATGYAEAGRRIRSGTRSGTGYGSSRQGRSGTGYSTRPKRLERDDSHVLFGQADHDKRYGWDEYPVQPECSAI